jgi:urocanate hydratase
LVGTDPVNPLLHIYSGTDSPYRETSNITDGSTFTADMAVQV